MEHFTLFNDWILLEECDNEIFRKSNITINVDYILSQSTKIPVELGFIHEADTELLESIYFILIGFTIIIEKNKSIMTRFGLRLIQIDIHMNQFVLNIISR